jgi:hypothetical protein
LVFTLAILEEEELLKNEEVLKIQLGPICEHTLCEACLTLVEDFSKLIEKNIKNIKYEYIDELLDAELCTNRIMLLKHEDTIVEFLCQNQLRSVSFQ